jgi:hypothetical protein
VIAVPNDGVWSDESDEAPRVRAARTLDNRSSEIAARALESQSDEQPHDATETDEQPLAGVDETPRGVLSFADGAEKQRGSASDVGSTTGEVPPPAAPAAAPGQTFTVRRILVECVGCGHHVAVPPAFFGKTVRCPECRADMAFSESSLEPVKDEILGRIALEQAERRVLKSPVPPPIESPEVRRRARRKQLAIVVLLGVALLAAIAIVAWKAWGRAPAQ